MTSSTSPARPWWQPEAFDYSRLQLFLMRLGFAALIFWNIKWETRKFTTQDHPNGLAQWFDFTWLAHNPPDWGLKGLTIAGLLLYVVGIVPVIGLLPVLFFAMSIGTLVLSQGEIQHSWQLITLMGLAQWAVYLFHDRKSFFKPSYETQRQAAYWSTVVIAAGYVVCGLVKVLVSKGLWIWKSPFLAVQVMKTNWANYYDTLEKPAAWLESTTQFLVDHPWLTRAFFGSGLLIELFAFVILINRRWAFWFGLSMISLHWGISELMNLHFIQHIIAILIFLIMPNIPGIWPKQTSEGKAA